ncbi:hypothetical protein M0R45_019513 [Rubus argutus]|uniref:Uncharacterized protein n=1 Tax=Rubus argutus TaxID=59490 RepID=A0AAW1X950_RUBAR
MLQHQASKEAPSLLPLCIHAVCSSSSPRRWPRAQHPSRITASRHQPPVVDVVLSPPMPCIFPLPPQALLRTRFYPCFLARPSITARAVLL